ncbi:unnamed protein product [Ceutorhynchus assimilis]|uniref:PHD-type domain-containing protein n=1 Tax=Ceutorhynchus assimilis TaxID=467358 RepID=A0A9N9MHV7_9CUCU|nr:unnamed protein product [Ceutorhynchus assimilis]
MKQDSALEQAKDVDFIIKTAIERDPKKRRVKPVEQACVLDFDEESSDDSDFRIEDHPEISDDEEDSNTDENKGKQSTSESESEDSELDKLDELRNLNPPDTNGFSSIANVIQKAGLQSQLNFNEKDADLFICCGCLGDHSDGVNEIVECDSCGATVHEGCYGISDSNSLARREMCRFDQLNIFSTNSLAPTAPWFCEACRAGVKDPVCELCPNSGGIFKETDVGKWVHLICALYAPGVAFGEVDKLTSVTLFEMPYSKWGTKTCSLCADERFSRTGVCIGCDAGMCKTYFHVTCAQREGFLSEAHTEEVDQADPFYAHCKLHSDKTLVKKRKRNYLAWQLRMQYRKMKFDKEGHMESPEQLVSEVKPMITDISNQSMEYYTVSADDSISCVSESVVADLNGKLEKTSSPIFSISEDNSSSHHSCSSNCTCCWMVSFKNHNKYEGNLSDNLMEGKGVFYWHDGSVYRGEFKDGYPCGQGKITLPDLSTYEGQFCMGFFHGSGNFSVKSSPILYNGEWKISKRNGKGWLFYETDNWYDGLWVNNKKQGSGYRHYPNGSKYSGNWVNDWISGEGSMLWENNDYYRGGWLKGQRHGYGEYTWNLVDHGSFVFPNYNTYKGNWVKCKRSGIGIMDFGHESGAKFAGTWQENRKHGPGVMICGNGMILERNPIFWDDKPATLDHKIDESSNSLLCPSTDTKDKSGLKIFKSISQQIFAKEKLDALTTESIASLSASNANIKMSQYIQLLQNKTGNMPSLKIPIHNVIHEVDLEYFMGDITNSKSFIPNDDSKDEIETMINSKGGSVRNSPSCWNYLPSNAELSNCDPFSTSQQYPPSSIELKNLIINYLPQLRNIYKMYATLCVDETSNLSFEPVLIRLFLWQLYRDIGVTNSGGLSIVDIDEMLMKNPNSCLQTLNNPWEPIYFWQFLQAIVGVAYLLFTTENLMEFTPSSGFMYHRIRDFLDKKLLVNAGNFQGNCLTRLRNLVPIDWVYRLYTEVGEHHTIEELLKNTLLKPGQKTPCYKNLENETDSEYTIENGTNVVVSNHQLTYLTQSETIGYVKKYKGLNEFSCLGRRKILKFISKICPQILLPTGKYQLQYRLSFIEFYEAILLLSFEKVEFDRLAIIEDLKLQSKVGTKFSLRDMSRISTHSAGKKKKSKK